MRIAILWAGLSGYLNACMKELAGRRGVELFVTHLPAESEAPFDDAQYSWISNRFVFRSEKDSSELESRLSLFNPEILLFCSWNIPAYRRIARKMANRCWRVMGMDNAWLATPKQRAGELISRWFVQPLADAVWLPGERQTDFAVRLGFRQSAILRGLYSCDQPALERVHSSRLADRLPVPHSFLFVGRFVSTKGVIQLVEAHHLYRETSSDPWPLVCCGAGPLRDELEGRPGIRVEGFVQPDALLTMLATSGCLVLPSSFEPWAVVVHEATSAGLLVLASDKVGAAVHLVQSHYNGYIFDNMDVKGLAALMSHVASLSDARLDSMSRASHLLSKQFSPALWADTLLEAFAMSSLRRSADQSSVGCGTAKLDTNR
jgi:glycosyltransferase involved in cell wall biosynthesis